MQNKDAYDKVLLLAVGNEFVDLSDKVNILTDIDDFEVDDEKTDRMIFECKQCF